MKFVAGITVAMLAAYVPVIILNSFPHSYLNASDVIVKYPFEFPNVNVITDFLRYEQNWYAEGSWMLGFFTNTSPLRHYIFVGLFATMTAVISLKGLRMQKEQIQTALERANLVLFTSFAVHVRLFVLHICLHPADESHTSSILCLTTWNDQALSRVSRF